MATQVELKVGPVLSFRGVTEQEGAVLWKVSALVGVAAGTAVPRLRLADREVAPPLLLAQRAGLQLLRYDFTVELADQERRIRYAVDGTGLSWEFTVPGKHRDVRTAYVSCNGFSDPRAMRKLSQKAGAVWQDLVSNHDRHLHPDAPVDKEQLWHLELGHGDKVQRFHVLVMGGDQLYFDSIWEDIPALKEWADLDRDAQLAYSVGPELERQIGDYYFATYCERWLKPSRGGWTAGTQERDCADAMARIPTIMMWDDHDIFDGWGSYTPQMQQCAVARTLFSHARQAFWVYQMQHRLDQLPPLEDRNGGFPAAFDAPQFKPIAWSQRLASDPLALPLLDDQPGFNWGCQLGKVALLALDLRTERSRKQILCELTWKAMQGWLDGLPPCSEANPSSPKHLLVLSSVPVVHPKLKTADRKSTRLNSSH